MTMTLRRRLAARVFGPLALLAILMASTGPVRAQSEVDLAGAAALALAAYEDGKSECDYPSGVETMLSRIDEFLGRTQKSAWSRLKDQAPALLPAARNQGRFLGSSKCSVYVNLITFVKPVYLFYLDPDPKIDSGLQQLETQQAKKAQEEGQSFKRRRDCDPTTGPGMVRQYRRKQGEVFPGPPCLGEENDEITRNPPPRRIDGPAVTAELCIPGRPCRRANTLTCRVGSSCELSDNTSICDPDTATQLADPSRSDEEVKSIRSQALRSERCVIVSAGTIVSTEASKSPGVTYLTQGGQHLGYAPTKNLLGFTR